MRSFLTQEPASSLPQHPISAQKDPPASGPPDSSAPVYLQLKRVALTVGQRLKTHLGRRASLNRFSTHLVVMILVITAISLRNVSWLQNRTNRLQPLKLAPAQPAASIIVEAGQPLTLPDQLNDLRDDVLVRAAVPRTIIPDRTAQAGADQNRTEIRTYRVETGDTVYGIAAKFGLAPETITWANHELEDNPDVLHAGQTLIILPIDGVYHQVGSADTIEGIAATYQTDPAAIINFPLNALNPDTLLIQPGQWLVVPGGSKPYVPRTVTAYSGPVPENAAIGTGLFVWPASGTIMQGYWTGHQALDIAAYQGAPILAADSGHVVFAGWDDTGYGYTVVIDHGNGFQTLYAHLQEYYVAVGDNVAKGEEIAAMGSTGNSTGPHVNFEIRQGTVQRNPLGFLP